MSRSCEYQKLNSLKSRLDHEYLKFSIEVCNDKIIAKWLRDLDLKVVRIIDPPKLGIASVEHLWGEQGVAWMGFEHGSKPDRDVWYFHPEDRDAAMLFKLTWVK